MLRIVGVTCQQQNYSMATYFKNTELADKHRISESTVRNWVKSAKEGKLPLELIELRGRSYVAKSMRNVPIIEALIEQNRKYRNTLTLKTIKPKPELFRIYSESQIYDIFRSLESHHEIPLQYGYFREGAREWNEYINKQATIEAPSMLRGTMELLNSSSSYVDWRVRKFEKINVIDIGVGNAVPVRGFIKHLIDQKKLNRYVAVDFSSDMLDIAKQNLQSWFGNEINFEGYVADMAYDRFPNILAEDYLGLNGNTVNIFLLLGATPNNLRVPSDAFRTICESMNPKDLFIYTDSIRAYEDMPEWFEYNYDVKPQEPELLRRHRFVLDNLNIDESFYTPDIGFDAATKQRYSRVKLKFAINLKLELEEGERVIKFEKGDYITLWRCWRKGPQALMGMLEDNGFYNTHTSLSEDRNYMITISEVRRDV
jgi:uncharacterized SAM-dependent methyltransferase